MPLQGESTHPTLANAFSPATEFTLESVLGGLGMDPESLSPHIRNLLNALLLYKSMFVGPWFAALSVEEDPETVAVYKTIREETSAQARRAADILRRWDESSDNATTQKVTDQVLKRLLADMLELKKSSTEVFLGAGIGSPTDQLRREFLELADIDRRHAETLRAALGSHLPQEPTKVVPAGSRGFKGIRQGPFPSGTLSETIRASLDQARGEGHEPSRIVLSNMCLRHLRDEGSVEPRQGNVFGVPVDVDFSWADEAFAITSRDRLSLAEIVTEMAVNERAHAD